ncbi:STAS domain-containing protein [Nocardia sp. NPDC127606]|uniref:STAS domain-containing protein n=1 Tax=Nocardia sp. NPDC127606 TaxID=3345406 RepID=UPI0036325DF6
MNNRPDETRSHAPGDPADDLCRRLGAVAESAGQVIVLHARGEIDAYTLPRWRGLLESAVPESADGGHLIVDMDEVTFLSVRAIMVLADLAEHLDRRGIGMHLADGRAATSIARVIDLAGMTEWISIHRDLTTALAATAGPPSDA